MLAADSINSDATDKRRVNGIKGIRRGGRSTNNNNGGGSSNTNNRSSGSNKTVEKRIDSKYLSELWNYYDEDFVIERCRDIINGEIFRNRWLITWGLYYHHTSW